MTRRATLLFCLTLLVMPVLPAFAQDDDSTLSPISGQTHSQEDVMVQKVKAQ